MVYYLSFRVRSQYIKAIARGDKMSEVRRVSTYWTRRVLSVLEAWARRGPVLATFLCGRRTFRREVRAVAILPDPVTALGREPSEQGRKDLGDGPVYVFTLGREANSGIHQQYIVQV